jgi:hypothetical protein
MCGDIVVSRVKVGYCPYICIKGQRKIGRIQKRIVMAHIRILAQRKQEVPATHSRNKLYLKRLQWPAAWGNEALTIVSRLM